VKKQQRTRRLSAGELTAEEIQGLSQYSQSKIQAAADKRLRKYLKRLGLKSGLSDDEFKRQYECNFPGCSGDCDFGDVLKEPYGCDEADDLTPIL
jgi:hypothetical protein